jgi:transglutaminase-like putative cysteine protease
MKCWKLAALGIMACSSAAPTISHAAENGAALTTRFTYEAAVPDTGAPLRLWMPLPSSSEWHTVRDVDIEGVDAYQVNKEARHGNRMVYVEAPQGPLKIRVAFTVDRRDVRVLANNANNVAQAQPIASWLEEALAGDAKVPIGGRYGDMARQLAGDKTGATGQMRAFFDNVVATMQYDYNKESPKLGEGDVAFVCDYKKGNCSDLHSYIISMGRSMGVPAILEYGFPITGIPTDEPLKTEGKISGYHCWTWFRDGERWIPLDASDSRRWLDKGNAAMSNFQFGNLVTPRSAVAMSMGRDITLVPAQQAPPLNYFIYPYAESKGQPVKAEWTLTYNLLDFTKVKP